MIRGVTSSKRETILVRHRNLLRRRMGGVCLIFLVLGSLAFSAANSAGYHDDISFDLGRVPFSRYGSYLAFSHLTKGPLGEGLYLRSLHRGVRPEVVRVELIRDGEQSRFANMLRRRYCDWRPMGASPKSVSKNLTSSDCAVAELEFVSQSRQIQPDSRFLEARLVGSSTARSKIFGSC